MGSVEEELRPCTDKQRPDRISAAAPSSLGFWPLSWRHIRHKHTQTQREGDRAKKTGRRKDRSEGTRLILNDNFKEVIREEL